MNDQIFDDYDLEKKVKESFGINVDVDTVIARSVPAGRSVDATIFLTGKKQLYAYIDSQTPLTLGDVQKIAGRIGLKVESYAPPKDQPDYFDEIGATKFREVFPGRKVTGPEDIAYYRKLSPYRPALVLVSEVLDGTIYQYDPDAATGWRPSTKFTYRRIRTS